LFFNFELWIAYRYFRAKRDDGFISIISWFSLIGISLGVATLIIVMSVMNGFRDELLTRIIGLNGHATLYVNNNNLNKEDYGQLKSLLFNFEDVKDVTSLVESTVMVSKNNKNRGVLVKGISYRDLIKSSLLSNSINEESLALFKQENFVIIGTRLAKNLGITPGDNFTLISSSGASTPFGDAPLAKNFILAGTFDIGMYEYDASVVFMKINELRNFIGVNNNYIDLVEIFYVNPDLAENINQKIQVSLNKNNSKKYYIVPWTSRHKQLFNALEVERNVMFVILTLIILVAAFNIVSSMIMLVRDKHSSIAILRTMGMSESSMMKVFIMLGASIGFLGTFIGALIGILFSMNISHIQELIEKFSGKELFAAEIYFLSKLPAKIDFSEVVIILVLSITISLLATVYPAWRASKVDPVKVLRNV